MNYKKDNVIVSCYSVESMEHEMETIGLIGGMSWESITLRLEYTAVMAIFYTYIMTVLVNFPFFAVMVSCPLYFSAVFLISLSPMP